MAPYGYDERYKFTAKERDTETGYDFSALDTYLQQQRKEFEELGYRPFTTEEYIRKYQEALEYLRRKESTIKQR